VVERKHFACCSLCDKPLFEVVSRHMDGPYKGEIKQIGQPMPGVRRVTVVRVSGNTSNWSLCEECEVIPENIAVINKREVAAMVYESRAHPSTMEQSERKERLLRVFEFDIPLGVLGEMPWSEVR
jgi:hypothetical protein